MRNTVCCDIRHLLKLPAPKAMSKQERWAYRTLKRQLSRLPHDQRAAYLTSAALEAAIRRKLTEGVAHLARR